MFSGFKIFSVSCSHNNFNFISAQLLKACGFFGNNFEISLINQIFIFPKVLVSYLLSHQLLFFWDDDTVILKN